jgi:biotin carboxylase
MPRVMLILPSSSYRVDDYLAAAAALHAEVVVASVAAQTLAPAMGERFLRIDPRRPEWSADRIVAAAARQPLDAVIPVDDQGVLVAALASARLGLAHNPPEAVAATRDKSALRTMWATAGVPQPAFALAPQAGEAAATAVGVGFPVVVKPIGLSASRGVIRADDAAAAAAAEGRIRRILADAGCDDGEPLLVEEYLPGDEAAVEGLLIDGRLRVLAILDKPDPLTGPYFEETIFVTPSRHSPSVQQEIVSVVEQAIAALGLRVGPVHAEVRITAEGIRMLELAARPIGGLCGRSLRFGLLGASLETLLVRQALGYPSAVTEPRAASTGVMMLPIAKAGTLRAVHGRDEALAVPGIVGLEVTIPRGETVTPLPEGDRYLGFLFAAGAYPAATEDSLRTAFAKLDFVIS